MLVALKTLKKDKIEAHVIVFFKISLIKRSLQYLQKHELLKQLSLLAVTSFCNTSLTYDLMVTTILGFRVTALSKGFAASH